MRPRRSLRLDRLARVHDAEIGPVWTDRYAELLLRGLSLPAGAMVLDAAAGTGGTSRSLLRILDDAGLPGDGGRVIALDASSLLLDVARARTGSLDGQRVFFRAEPPGRLPFPDETFDAVVSNLGLEEGISRLASLSELARTCRGGGAVRATAVAAGTWAEVVDLLREALLGLGRDEACERLDAWAQAFPDATRLAEDARAAGLVDVTLVEDRFTMLFKSSREFFCSPVIELGPLVAWRDIAGGGEAASAVLLAVRDSIDAYYGDAPFAVTVHAACIVARAPDAATRAERAAQTESEESAAREHGSSTDAGGPRVLTEELDGESGGGILDEDAEAEALARDLDRIAAPRAPPAGLLRIPEYRR